MADANKDETLNTFSLDDDPRKGIVSQTTSSSNTLFSILA
jgi:hypothetical protein